jgi:SHS family lactate transporter-like MFS transporter
MNAPVAAAPSTRGDPPFERWGGVTREQWNAFLAAFLAWVFLGFDFTILTFLLGDIQRRFTVTSALAGALGTVTLLFRVAGGVATGTSADKWGRKTPLMFAVAWYSLFAFLSGFATSYPLLFACRALFGIGMGSVWAAGMPLALEHWPTTMRGLASGLLQSGYAVGFVLSAVVYQYGYPWVEARADEAWRVMLWIGVAPGLLVFWIRSRVSESPIWLEGRRLASDASRREGLSLGRLFAPDLRRATIQTSLLMAAFLAFYQAIAFWYPTLLGELERRPLMFLVAFNLGGIAGSVLIGRLSETALGRRGAATVATMVAVAVVPLYVFSTRTPLLVAGAMAMGFGTGNFGMVPGYLNERFPTAARAAGAGFAYHVGAAVAAPLPYIVGSLRDGGMPLAVAMGISIAATGILALVALWSGPETRGRSLTGAADVRDQP